MPKVSKSHNAYVYFYKSLNYHEMYPSRFLNSKVLGFVYLKFIDWESSQHSLLNLAISKPSPGSTTLEDVLDSLLGLPPSVPRIASPQNSPRRAPSPYYMIGLQVCRQTA